MSKKLYVGNLSYEVDSSALQQLFSAHGTVTSAQIIDDRDTGRSKGLVSSKWKMIPKLRP